MLKEALEKIAYSMHLAGKPADPLMPHISTYGMKADFGSGNCNIYMLGQIAAFISMDLYIKKEVFFECFAGYGYIGWFSGINAERVVNGAGSPLPSGTAFAGILSSDEGIQFTDKGGLKGLLVIFSPFKYEKYLRLKFGIDISQELNDIKKISGSVHTPEMPLIIRQIEEHITGTTGLTSGLFCESKLHEIISVYLHSLQNRKCNDEASEPTKEVLKINREDVLHIASVTKYICANPDKNISLKELSSIACMSPAKLKYTFKAVQGCTVSEFKESFKTERARDLLTETELTVKEIALSLAFGKPGSFTAFFRRRTGFTPSDYRQLHRDARNKKDYLPAESPETNMN